MQKGRAPQPVRTTDLRMICAGLQSHALPLS